MRNPQPLEYQMTKKMFNAMLNKRTNAEEKENPYKYVMDVINEGWGLKGTVVKLSII